MRSPSVLLSFIGIVFLCAFPQSVAKRDAVIEHETFAAPAAFRFRHAFQISENAALEVIDLGKTAREQVGAGLFAADAAGAEHRDLPMPGRVELALGEFPELPETSDAGIDRSGKAAHRDLEGI